MQERQAGQYRADVMIAGHTDFLLTIVPAGAVEPMEPALLLPEVADKSRWLDGRLAFADDGNTYILVFTEFVKAPFAYNTRQVRAEEVGSYWDLLDPKWRGKLVMRDPQTAGPGNATAVFWYVTEGLGPEYLRRLFTEQDVLLLRDDRQILDMVARGERPIAIAPSDLLTKELMDKGLPVALSDAATIRESSYLTPGFGCVVLLEHAPHPNAAKVYLNWVLSQETQTLYSKASGYPSRRADVPRDHITPSMLRKPGVRYLENYKDDTARVTPEMVEYLKTVIRQ
jgi:iron(III) transport system substrate-binding protein